MVGFHKTPPLHPIPYNADDFMIIKSISYTQFVVTLAQLFDPNQSLIYTANPRGYCHEWQAKIEHVYLSCAVLIRIIQNN